MKNRLQSLKKPKVIYITSVDVFTCSLVKHPGAFQALEFRVLMVKYFRYLDKDSNMASIGGQLTIDDDKTHLMSFFFEVCLKSLQLDDCHVYMSRFAYGNQSLA